MTPLAQLKLALGLGLAILIALGLWYLHHDGYEEGKTEVQAAWDKDKGEQAQAREAVVDAFLQRQNQAEAQHDQDQARITQLAADAASVHIHLPTCAGNAAQTGAHPDGRAGVFSDRVDQLFAEFQARTGRLIARCDQLNIDAIRANGEAGK